MSIKVQKYKSVVAVMCEVARPAGARRDVVVQQARAAYRSAVTSAALRHCCRYGNNYDRPACDVSQQ